MRRVSLVVAASLLVACGQPSGRYCSDSGGCWELDFKDERARVILLNGEPAPVWLTMAKRGDGYVIRTVSGTDTVLVTLRGTGQADIANIDSPNESTRFRLK